MGKSIIFITILVSLVGALFSCATTRLEDYKPESTQEKEVLEVFNEMIGVCLITRTVFKPNFG